MEAGPLLGHRYRLVAPIRRGGTSVVWQARDEVLRRDVAVKLLDGRLASDPALVTRLRAEAQAAARLVHPHVVTVYDFGEASRPEGRPIPYVVLELVDGQPLSEVLGQGPLPWQEAVAIGAQVAAALAAAHAHGIVHRDIKPDNVMLTGSGAKLVDFGISATIGDTDLGPDGQLLCTPAYLAPERLETGPVRAASDVYGLGLLVYKSLTGELPWRWEDMHELLAAHRRVTPAPLPPLPGLPAEVAELCRRCLAKRPADRPSSAETARLLARAAGTAAAAVPVPTLAIPPDPDGQEAPTVGAHPVAGRRIPTGRRRRVLAPAAAGVMLLGLAVGSGTAPVDGAPEGPVACQACAPVQLAPAGPAAPGLVEARPGRPGPEERDGAPVDGGSGNQDRDAESGSAQAGGNGKGNGSGKGNGNGHGNGHGHGNGQRYENGGR